MLEYLAVGENLMETMAGQMLCSVRKLNGSFEALSPSLTVDFTISRSSSTNLNREVVML